jgi:hydroxymethylpyrimidine pyrophosphatase-like HAD family hydrolase
LDTYLEALKDFPRQDQKLMTQKGEAVCQKIDIFKGKLWYAYEKEYNNWIELDTDAVKTILKAQREKKPVASLEEFSTETLPEKADFSNTFDEDSLTRFDKPKRKKTRNKRKSNKHKKSKKNNANS